MDGRWVDGKRRSYILEDGKNGMSAEIDKEKIEWEEDFCEFCVHSSS